jgi:hypothetical protein
VAVKWTVSHKLPMIIRKRPRKRAIAGNRDVAALERAIVV